MDIQYHECDDLKKAIAEGLYVRLAGGGLGQYRKSDDDTLLTVKMREELSISRNRRTLRMIEKCPFCEKPSLRRLS